MLGSANRVPFCFSGCEASGVEKREKPLFGQREKARDAKGN